MSGTSPTLGGDGGHFGRSETDPRRLVDGLSRSSSALGGAVRFCHERRPLSDPTRTVKEHGPLTKGGRASSSTTRSTRRTPGSPRSSGGTAFRAGASKGDRTARPTASRSTGRAARSSVTRLPLAKGDVVRLITGTGGGFGDPRERPRALVAEDLRNGYVTERQAREHYGWS